MFNFLNNIEPQIIKYLNNVIQMIGFSSFILILFFYGFNHIPDILMNLIRLLYLIWFISFGYLCIIKKYPFTFSFPYFMAVSLILLECIYVLDCSVITPQLDSVIDPFTKNEIRILSILAILSHMFFFLICFSINIKFNINTKGDE